MRVITAFEIVFAAVIWSWIGYVWWQRREAGALLVEFEPNQGPSLRPVLLAVLLMFTGVGLVVGLTRADVGIDVIARSVFTSAIAAGVAAQMFLAPQIRQHGLLIHRGLIRWSTIKRYTWERNTPHALTLQVHTSLRLRATRTITMPPIYRDKVEAVLAQHVPHSVPD
jgi:hypothetical protein